MLVQTNVSVPLRGGDVVMANVFRPDGDGPWPVILNFSPYGKDVHFSEFEPRVWDLLQREHPEITEASSLEHFIFEAPDPEVWTRHGYAVVRVDSRGSGKSPGVLHPNSPQEFEDAYDAIEWAGTAPWSNGRVGMLGISYYAASQWMVAALRPPHLAAIQPWQGTYDLYRDRTRQGGMFSSGFVQFWWNAAVLENQHGNKDSRFHDYFTGEINTGTPLPRESLRLMRNDYVQDVLDHPLEDDWYRARIADLSRIDVPALVGANWGGLQVHLRGTLLGYEGIASTEKWLLVQRGSYFLSFYHPENVDIQRRFFDRFLRGEEDAWTDVPRVQSVVRSMGDGVSRTLVSDRWPVPSTEQRWYLDAETRSLRTDAPSTESVLSYDATGPGATFTTGPLPSRLQFAGPIELRVRLATNRTDADVHVVLQAFDADGVETTFESAGDPNSPVSLGWLRASHRAVDEKRSGYLRPFHTHARSEPLDPDTFYDLRIEVWPASLDLPPGAELRMTVSGIDFNRGDALSANHVHNHPVDRPSDVFDGEHTLATGPSSVAYLALPVLENER